jgi:tRNA pseudouridine38-40 synthase
MRQIRLTLQYDGTDYSGWQIQKNGATIQGVLEDAIFSVTNDRSRVTGAGRTDAGVHAFEQVAVFETASTLSTDVFLQALNANLPNDISITCSEECPEDFHPRYRAKQKRYSYIISNRTPGSVFLNRYSWQMNYQLNIEAMRNASEYLIGRHDFSSFQASGCSAKHPVRELNSITISDLPSLEFITFRIDTPVIKITIEGSAFLRHMVRNITGTLVDIGRGKYPPEKIKEILLSRDRNNAGPTAPACGLFLEKIVY